MSLKDSKKDFSFIEEQIITKPFYKKKWFLKTVSAVGLAILFGGVAGLSYAVVSPWAEKQFGQPEDAAQIVIVQEETETETETESETVRETSQETEMETEIQMEEAPRQLELSDYEQLYQKMHAVAQNAAASLITVAGVTSDVDIFNVENETSIQTCGLIVASSKSSYYLLVNYDVIEGAERILAILADGTRADAQLVKFDEDTSLAVVRLPLKSVPENLRNQLSVASIGATDDISIGSPILAVGSPRGYSESMIFGMITSLAQAAVTDGEYQLISTDMMGSGNESGILIGIDGEILGIINNNFQKNGNAIVALNMRDIASMVECLSNDDSMPYIGITGIGLTRQMGKDLGNQEGVYITGVSEESPAMYAGIQNGDILMEMDDSKVTTMEEYREILNDYKEDEVHTLHIKRDGEEISLEVTISSK